MMVKIVEEVTRMSKGSRFGTNEKENNFFGWIPKQNPKTYHGKEDPVLLEG